MTLLDVLARTPGPGPAQAARGSKPGLHPSTAHRILGAMTGSGFRRTRRRRRLSPRHPAPGTRQPRQIAHLAARNRHAGNAQAPRRHRRERQSRHPGRRRDRLRRAHLQRTLGGARGPHRRRPGAAAHHRHRQALPRRRTAPRRSRTTPSRTGLPATTAHLDHHAVRPSKRNSTRCAATAWLTTWTRWRTGYAASPPASATTAASWWQACPCPPRPSASIAGWGPLIRADRRRDLPRPRLSASNRALSASPDP
jgi:hypothetical protein